MMNKMTNDNIVEEALSQLNMKYRSVTYKKSLIYFVTTENGTIFDISIWRKTEKFAFGNL